MNEFSYITSSLHTLNNKFHNCISYLEFIKHDIKFEYYSTIMNIFGFSVTNNTKSFTKSSKICKCKFESDEYNDPSIFYLFPFCSTKEEIEQCQMIDHLTTLFPIYSVVSKIIKDPKYDPTEELQNIELQTTPWKHKKIQNIKYIEHVIQWILKTIKNLIHSQVQYLMVIQLFDFMLKHHKYLEICPESFTTTMKNKFDELFNKDPQMNMYEQMLKFKNGDTTLKQSWRSIFS